jgi:hypothetical protein
MFSPMKSSPVSGEPDAVLRNDFQDKRVSNSMRAIRACSGGRYQGKRRAQVPRSTRSQASAERD